MVAHIADFIRADERTHVRKGQHIISCMTDMKRRTWSTRRESCSRNAWQALGALPEEGNAAILTREEIERLVGE